MRRRRPSARRSEDRRLKGVLVGGRGLGGTELGLGLRLLLGQELLGVGRVAALLVLLGGGDDIALVVVLVGRRDDGRVRLLGLGQGAGVGRQLTGQWISA